MRGRMQYAPTGKNEGIYKQYAPTGENEGRYNMLLQIMVTWLDKTLK